MSYILKKHISHKKKYSKNVNTESFHEKSSVLNNEEQTFKNLQSNANQKQPDIDKNAPFHKDGKKKTLILKNYFLKMKGEEKSPPRVSLSEMAWTWCGIFTSMCFIFFIDSNFREITAKYPLLFASIGASAVLIFGLPTSEYSQPRSVIGGHFFSAIAGVTAYRYLKIDPILAAAMAVSLASFLMAVTNTMHPPGGATALLAVIGSEDFHHLGYWFAITPCVTSASILVFLGIIINNLSKERKYPRFWW